MDEIESPGGDGVGESADRDPEQQHPVADRRAEPPSAPAGDIDDDDWVSV
jgi:hypothetical protein